MVEKAADALYRDGNNLGRWCGVCSSEMCDDCIAIRDDAARAALDAVEHLIAEREAQAEKRGYERGYSDAVHGRGHNPPKGER
jgi:hypothetical protein